MNNMEKLRNAPLLRVSTGIATTMHDDELTLGSRLSKARKLAGLSQVALAQRCGWDSASRISMYERDDRNPTLPVARKLAAALSVREEWLISGTPPRDTSELATFSYQAVNRRVPVKWIAEMRYGNTAPALERASESPAAYTIAPTQDEEAYLVVVRGDGLSPPLLNGWGVVVEPSQHPVAGEYALIVTEDQAGIWQFLYESNGSLTVSAPQDPSIRLTLLRRDVLHACAIGPIVPPSRIRE